MLVRDVQMSRTYRLYDAFVKTYQQHYPEDVLEEIILRNKALYALLAENIEKRNQLLAQKNLQDPIFHYAIPLPKLIKLSSVPPIGI